MLITWSKCLNKLVKPGYWFHCFPAQTTNITTAISTTTNKLPSLSENQLLKPWVLLARSAIRLSSGTVRYYNLEVWFTEINGQCTTHFSLSPVPQPEELWCAFKGRKTDCATVALSQFLNLYVRVALIYHSLLCVVNILTNCLINLNANNQHKGNEVPVLCNDVVL